MNSTVWPELDECNMLGHQIMENFIKDASKEALFEKIWWTIKESDSDEAISDILYMAEAILGVEYCETLYAELKVKKNPFRVKVAMKGNSTSEVMYFTEEGKFSVNEEDAALFPSIEVANEKFSKEMSVCMPLFESIQFDIEEYRNGVWLKV